MKRRKQPAATMLLAMLILLAPPIAALHGRFLQITDIHPDPYYTVGASPADACHVDPNGMSMNIPDGATQHVSSHNMSAASWIQDTRTGYYGAANTSCDTPFSLVNLTFDYIEREWKDKIDFIIWTGDNARHDNDNRYPRSVQDISDLNQIITDKFLDIFRNELDPRLPLSIPIVPTYGNNDIWPHNIFTAGPNPTTLKFAGLWDSFIPEYERHTFERGGYFSSEVIPNTLTVISLNTLYFFAANAAVDGCSKPSEPGYDQFEWLRFQLEELRFRNMKAWIIGHVPPALNKGPEKGWTYDCSRKYFYWMRAYRDVVVGHLFGHQNIDHFDLLSAGFVNHPSRVNDDDFDKEFDSHILDQGETASLSTSSARQRRINDEKLHSFQRKEERYLDQVRDLVYGGVPKKEKHWGDYGDHWLVYTVAVSVIPKYMPGLRIVEYNISGLEGLGRRSRWVEGDSTLSTKSVAAPKNIVTAPQSKKAGQPTAGVDDYSTMSKKKRKHKKKKDKKHPNEPRLPRIRPPPPPDPPTGTPPGPAFSPQPLTPIKYTQYFFNVTTANIVHASKRQRHSEEGSNTKRLGYEVEYSTSDEPYSLPDLTVLSYLRLARRLASTKPASASAVAKTYGDDGKLITDDVEDDSDDDDDDHDEQLDDYDMVEKSQNTRPGAKDDQVHHEKHRKKHRKKPPKKHKGGSKDLEGDALWQVFLRRALVGIGV